VLDNLAPQLAGTVRGALWRDDDYHRPGKPPCDCDDRAAREALVDELVRDALSALAALDGASCRPRHVTPPTCWPWWPARTSNKATTGASVSPGK
jgi:hypothetical protein